MPEGTPPAAGGAGATPEAGPVPSDRRQGLAAGLLLVGSLANAALGVPAFLALLLHRARLRLPPECRPAAILLGLKLAWVLGVFVVYDAGQAPLRALLPMAAADVMMLAFLALPRRSTAYLEALAWAVFGLLVLDLLFNVYAAAFGADPLGRELVHRPDDIIPRVGGVFGHAFQSLNISLVALLLAWHLRRRVWVVLAVANVLVNGSFRGVLTLCVGLVTWGVLRLRRLPFAAVAGLLALVAAAVFGVTILSVVWSGFRESGNLFRVFAWVNAVDVIGGHPLVGYHGFAFGELDGIGFDTISEYGIAESTYLDYAMRFGVLAALLHLAVMTQVLARRVGALRAAAPGDERYQRTAALLAGVLFVDTFYGSMLGAVLPTAVFGYFCLSAGSPDPGAAGDGAAA